MLETKQLHGVAALRTAELTPLHKVGMERDTECVKRIVVTYLNACIDLGVDPISRITNR